LKITNEILKTHTFSIEWNKFFVKIPPTIQDMQISLLEHDDPLTKVQINAPLIKQLFHAFTVKTRLMEQEYKEKSIKESLEKRCQDYKDNQSDMIDSLINRHRKTIRLDRCIDRSLNNNGLLTNPTDVMNETKRHFQQVTGTVHHFKEIPEDWIPWYNPKDDIDPIIYDNLMSAPTENEWETVINNLPSNKAPGLSKINNEMLKNMGAQTKKKFWIFICSCLTKSILPDAWNLAFVYPVPKPKP
jgi:hypothetical protein